MRLGRPNWRARCGTCAGSIRTSASCPCRRSSGGGRAGDDTAGHLRHRPHHPKPPPIKCAAPYYALTPADGANRYAKPAKHAAPLDLFACGTVERLRDGIRRYVFTFIDPCSRFAFA
ncbi:hypothetical protein [Candidatus Spongiihabitans sp.]|uniref:hypothetical protein n=1 Tax=Candidatus Spongiihabitans sp. TaxID=3101308 RepID=UPI003C6F3E42